MLTPEQAALLHRHLPHAIYILDDFGKPWDGVTHEEIRVEPTPLLALLERLERLEGVAAFLEDVNPEHVEPGEDRAALLMAKELAQQKPPATPHDVTGGSI